MTESAQRQYIRDNYLKVPIKTIAGHIGRSQTFVRGQMVREKLIVPPEIVEQRKKDSRYQPGQTAHNKGVPMHQWMSDESMERVKATQFQEGHLPHNTREDGALSVRYTHGYPYWWIRVELGHWKMLHRVLWEEMHGPIHSDCNIQFRNGDTLDVRLGNLHMINRKYQIRVNMNGGRTLPPELQRSIELTYKLKDKIKSRS